MQHAAIITGAGGGIGAAIAVQLAQQGLHTILLGRNGAKLKETGHKIVWEGGSASCYECDVTKPKEVHDFLENLQQDKDIVPLIMINNAGYGGPFVTTDELNEHEWDLIFQTNVKAAFLFCRHLLPLMKKHGFGRIVNISSVYGITGGALSAAYAASKHALAGYTKSLAAEWGRHNITCNLISPGFTNTQMGAAEAGYIKHVIKEIPAGRQANPAEIARLTAFLVQPDSSYINGADIVIDGGLLAGRSFHP